MNCYLWHEYDTCHTTCCRKRSNKTSLPDKDLDSWTTIILRSKYKQQLLYSLWRAAYNFLTGVLGGALIWVFVGLNDTTVIQMISLIDINLFPWISLIDIIMFISLIHISIRTYINDWYQSVYINDWYQCFYLNEIYNFVDINDLCRSVYILD